MTLRSLAGAVAGLAAMALATAPAGAVVGGRPVAAGWGWQVALVAAPTGADEPALQRLFCGGSLIAPAVVVTAAHCLVDEHGQLRAASAIHVITGRRQLSSGSGQEIAVTSYRLPSESDGAGLFDLATNRWDMAIVRLAALSRAATIALPRRAERARWRPGAEAYLAGWGEQVAGGPVADRLRVARVSLLKPSACTAAYGAVFEQSLMLCAGARGHDACARDSGGSLVARVGRGQFRLLGDISWGYEPCGTKPGVFGALALNPMRSQLRRMLVDP